MDKQMEWVTESVKHLIKVGVEKESAREKIYSDLYRELWMEIENTLEHAKTFYEELKKEGYAFGSVEAEGYLRCAKDISCIAAALGKRLEEEKPSEEGS